MRGGSLPLRKLLATLTASMLAQPVFAQAVVTPIPPPAINIIESVPLTPEERRTAAANEKEYLRMVRERGVFGHFLTTLDEPRRAIACDKVAEYLAVGSATASDLRVRVERLPAAWRLRQRVAPALETALASLSKKELERFEILFGEAMTMQSLIPDTALLKVGSDFSEGEFQYQMASVLAMRCHQSLDESGVPDVTTPPLPEYIETNSRFRFRGTDYAETFKDTELGDHAKGICSGSQTFDFTNAPLDQRGLEGMSLLDWAIECEDKPAFKALIAAGFDLDAPGLWEETPLVLSATEERLWYLREMLDAGANPNVMGRNRTALAEAMSDHDASNRGGDTRAAFNLLRERGASLNFPEYSKSIWFEWGLFGRHGGWQSILDHWDEFDSDPVELAELTEQVLKGDLEWLEGQKPQARKVKKLLIEKYGVCFPVGKTLEMEKDERGYLIQPNCPKKP